MKKLNLIFIGAVICFILSGGLSLLIINKTESIDSILQFLALSIILIIFTTRVIIPRIQTNIPAITYFFEFIPLCAFVYLLVFSTGGLASPFLILTHLFAIGMGFLIAPSVSIAFVFITIAFIVVHALSDFTAQVLLEQSPVAVALYILAYLGVIPFSQYISKIYQSKELWVKELSKMLVTSKKQEDYLLKNITEPVLILSRDLKITYINSASIDILKIENKHIGKKLMDLFSFKDAKGENIILEKLPFNQVITTKEEVQISGIQISFNGGEFTRINLKVLPVIEHSGEVLGLILILKKYSGRELTLSSYYDKLVSKLADYQQGKLYWTARNLLLLDSLEQGLENASSFINISEIVEGEMFKLENLANKKKVKITSPGTEKIPLGPIEPKFSPEKKGMLKAVFVNANPNLIKVAVNYLLETALAFCNFQGTVVVDVKSADEIVEIVIKSTSDLPAEKVKMLQLQFFTELIEWKGLEALNGLETAVAEAIFEKHGGSLGIEKKDENLIFTATLVKLEVPKSKEN